MNLKEEIDALKGRWMTTMNLVAMSGKQEELELMSKEADVVAMVSAADTYLQLAIITKEDTWMYNYLQSAAAIYRKKCEEILEEIRLEIERLSK